MAQIGEFSFVLLSRASNLGLVKHKFYLLLLGITAISLFTSPIILRYSPYLMSRLPRP
jgi:Kef-type K+ transport system membrane component KefB